MSRSMPPVAGSLVKASGRDGWYFGIGVRQQAQQTGRDRRGFGVELARRLGVAQRTAQRLLTAAEARH
jgi:hypothetical protein